jgi:hypothetical protein
MSFSFGRFLALQTLQSGANAFAKLRFFSRFHMRCDVDIAKYRANDNCASKESSL